MTAPVDSFIFFSTSASIPTAGAGNLTAGKVVISNIVLNLFVEDNLVLSNSVIEKWQKDGLKIRTDYVDTITTPINTTTAQININIPQLGGAKLKRIINCAFNSVESGATSQDCMNIGGDGTIAGTGQYYCKIASYQTMMDSQLLQNNIIDCTFSDAGHVGNTDYAENECFIQGSVINGLGMYMYNWAHIDDFSGDDSILNNVDLTNHDTGLSLANSRSYTLKLKTPNAATALYNLTLYSFIITSKVLNLSPAGAMWIV
jgi:hypothetical protein